LPITVPKSEGTIGLYYPGPRAWRQVPHCPQCPWFVLKQFRVHHYFLGRSNPGAQIVGSFIKSQLTTEADLQSSRHWEMLSTGSISDHRGTHDVSQCWGGCK